MSSVEPDVYEKQFPDGQVRTLTAYSPADQVRLEFSGWKRREGPEQPAAAPLQAPRPRPVEDIPAEPEPEPEPEEDGEEAAQVQAPRRRRAPGD